MRLTDARARAALARYRRHPLQTRAYAATRLLTCPFGAVLDALPPSPRVLDVGCGVGLLGHLVIASGGTVVGLDPDPRKVAVARASRAEGEPFEIIEGLLEDAPASPFDAVTFVDVLYLAPPDEQVALLDAAASRLAPGGRVIVKTVHQDSGWKTRLTRAQETVAVRGLGWTHGRSLVAPTPEHVANRLRGVGLSVSSRRIDQGYPHPHLLIVGERGP